MNVNAPEVGLRDQPVVDHLPRLAQDRRGVDDVEVADVGPEDGLQSQAEPFVEGKRGERVVGLAPEVEALGEQPADVVGAVDAHRRELVGVGVAPGELLLGDLDSSAPRFCASTSSSLPSKRG